MTLSTGIKWEVALQPPSLLVVCPNSRMCFLGYNQHLSIKKKKKLVFSQKDCQIQKIQMPKRPKLDTGLSLKLFAFFFCLFWQVRQEKKRNLILSSTVTLAFNDWISLKKINKTKTLRQSFLTNYWGEGFPKTIALIICFSSIAMWIMQITLVHIHLVEVLFQMKASYIQLGKEWRVRKTGCVFCL